MNNMNERAKTVCYGSLSQGRWVIILSVLANRILMRKAEKKAVASGKTLTADEVTANQFGVLIHGEPSIGKTAMTRGVHDDLNKLELEDTTGKAIKFGFYEANLSSDTPEDIGGFTSADMENRKMVFLPRHAIPRGSHGIVRIDEIDRSREDTRNAMTKVFIDRTADNSIPFNWTLVAIANGSADTGTERLTDHLNARFCHVYISANVSEYKTEYAKHMEQSGFDKSVARLASMNIMATRDEYENDAKYDPRSLSFADAMLTAYKMYNGAELNDGTTLDIPRKALLMALSGLISHPMAVELLALDELADLPTIDDVVKQPNTVTIPKDLDLVIKHTSMLVNEVYEKDANKLLTYLMRLHEERARAAIASLVAKWPSLATCKEYVKWSAR